MLVSELVVLQSFAVHSISKGFNVLQQAVGRGAGCGAGNGCDPSCYLATGVAKCML
jgi:hypothetical protein